jgi:hypothetical protein
MQRLVLCHQRDRATQIVIFVWRVAAHIVALGGVCEATDLPKIERNNWFST